MSDDWRGWKNGKYDNRYHGVKRHSGKKNHWKVIAIILGVFIIGFFIYHQYPNTILDYIKIINSQEDIKSIKDETVNQTIPAIEHFVTNTVAGYDPRPTNMTAIAFDIHNLINEQRRSHGLSLLSWNSVVSQAALNHSADMAKRNYFEHNDPEGHDFTYRYSQVGFNCQIPVSESEYSGGGENISYLKGYYGEENIASQTVIGWMNSPGHRANILTSYFQSEGIGVAKSDDGKIYATQDFC